jgi:hypothetical protein
MVEDYWEASKQMLMDGTFLDSLRSYDKDHIDPAIIKRIKVGIHTFSKHSVPADADTTGATHKHQKPASCIQP